MLDNDIVSLKNNIESLIETIAKQQNQMKEVKKDVEVKKEVVDEKAYKEMPNFIKADASNIQEFLDAYQGKYGEDQYLIVKVILEFALTLLRKNRNYGASVFKQPVLTPDISTDATIRVRMSDKIERLTTLFRGEKDLVGESVIDTVKDLAAYCILWLIYKEFKS